MLKQTLLMTVFAGLPITLPGADRYCSMSGATGGGGAEGGGGSAAAEGGAGAVEKPAATSILATAVDEGAAAAAAAAKDKPVVEGDKDKPVEETPEQKAERLKNETPEAKAAREAVEKVASDKKVADTLKTYDAIKLPEGMKKDQPALLEFLKDAAANGMPLDQAQKYVDTVGPKLQEAVDAPYKAWADMQTKWMTELKTDPEIGGAALKENLGLAAKALDTFAGDAKSPEGMAVREALEFTGAGNHPAIARMLVRVGKGLAEGAPLGGRSKGQGPDLAAAMYPTMQK